MKAIVTKVKWAFIIFGSINCAICLYIFLNTEAPDWGFLQYAVAIVTGPLVMLFGILGYQKPVK